MAVSSASISYRTIAAGLRAVLQIGFTVRCRIAVTAVIAAFEASYTTAVRPTLESRQPSTFPFFVVTHFKHRT